MQLVGGAAMRLVGGAGVGLVGGAVMRLVGGVGVGLVGGAAMWTSGWGRGGTSGMCTFELGTPLYTGQPT